MSEDLQHHRYGPSKAKATLLCPGKAAMEQGLPNVSNKYSEEGSAAHYLGAVCLKGKLNPDKFKGEKIHCLQKADGRSLEMFDKELAEFIGKKPLSDFGLTLKSTWTVDDEMLKNVTIYVKEVRRVAEKGDLYVEQRLPLSEAYGIDGAFGTGDAIVIDPEGFWIVCIDYKNGRDPVSPIENSQTMSYTAGAFEAFSPLYPGLTTDQHGVTCIQTIVQPRVLETPSSWVCAKEDIAAFTEKMRQAISMSEEAITFFRTPNLQFENFDEWSAQYLNPSEEACKWCLAAAHCPARASQSMDIILGEPSIDGMENLDTVAAVQAATDRITTLDFDTLARYFAAIPSIEKWIKAVEGRMLAELSNGVTHPDWKLVQGRQGNRQWASEGEAEEAMKSMRLKVDEMYEKRLKNPTTMEKVLAKRKRLWDKLEPLVTRSPGAISVAPMSDKRPAVIVSIAHDDMPDLSDAIDSTATTESSVDDFSDLL